MKDLGPDPGLWNSNPELVSPDIDLTFQTNKDLDLQILDVQPNPGSGPPIC